MRDDFSQSTKDTLFKRAGGKCSSPECRRSTSAPHTDDTKAINIGVAAHITAASVGGPRYDATLSQEERISATNGIWLCQFCGTLIDSDAERYSVDLLKRWKQEAESLALFEVENRNWARQVRGSPLESNTLVRCDFYTHISPPLIHHVKRAEIGEAVRAFFLSDEFLSETTISGKSRPVALQGIGGIGKTIIARALCEDPVIQATFSDGILGVVLGKMPELASKLREWIYALGGTVSDPTPTTDFLRNTLAQLLQDKACLLVIDDVWQRSHAEAFFVGGSRCQVVLTTRDAELARELGAKVQPIPPMTEGEAIHLLEKWADGHLTETALTLKKRIVKRLGYLPLAMKLAGAQLRRKPPQRWLQSFNVSKLKSPRLERVVHDDLERTFELSLEELHEQALSLYISLAIFKEDEAISQRGIERLWQGLAGLDAEATEELLKDLADRALIELTPHGPTQIVGLHDLLRDVIKAKLGGNYSGFLGKGWTKLVNYGHDRRRREPTETREYGTPRGICPPQARKRAERSAH